MKRIAILVISAVALASPALAFDPPIAVDINPDPDIVEVNLSAAETTWQFVSGVDTTVYAYNGTIPGPTIEAEIGNTLIVHFTNNLPEPTTIHWHGVDTPASMDGSHISQLWVQPGETFDYVFDVPHASIFWYHPHVRTFDQVEKGLYGGLLVRDPVKDAALGLTGLEEHIVFFDDVLLDGALNIVPAFSFTDPLQNADYHLNGRSGNYLLVNGKDSAAVSLTVDNGQPQRWRIINAANTTFTRLGIEELGVDLWWLGTDGGLLEFSQKRRAIDLTWPPGSPPPPTEGPQPLHPTQLLLAKTLEGVFLTPGERLDVVFTPLGDDGESFTVWQHDWLRGRHAAAYDPEGNIILPDDPLDGYYPSLPFMEIELTGANPGTGEFVPPLDLLTTISVPGTPEGVLPVTFGHGPPDPQGNVTLFAQADFSTGTMIPLPAAKIDSFNAHDVEVGETWTWEVTNLSHGDHPFHTHGFTFVPREWQWIDQQNPNQNITFQWPFKMRKDTIRIPARSGAAGMSQAIVRSDVYFDDTGREDDVVAQGQLPTFDPNGDWVSGGWLFHCHILEHSGKGMLSWYEVHDPDDPFTLLGKHLAGTNGNPSLTIDGDPNIAGSTLTYNLVNGRPYTLARLALGTSAARSQIKGGEFVPAREHVFAAFTDRNGNASWDIDDVWNQLASGETLYGQVAVWDLGSPQGLAFSNAISFVKP